MFDLHLAWPVLIPLATTLVTCVLGTLTRHQMHVRATHDLIRETRQQRYDYIASVTTRMASVEPDATDG